MKRTAFILFIALLAAETCGKNLTYIFKHTAGCMNYSPAITEMITKIRSEATSSDNVILRFEGGNYIFREEGTTLAEYYISNHDQCNPRRIVMNLSGIDNLTVDGRGSEFLMEGSMLPIVATGCRNLNLTNFTIDFLHPHIIQMEIVKNLGDGGMISYLAPWTKYDLDSEGKLLNCGEGWSDAPFTGLVFDKEKQHIAYRMTDIHIDTKGSDSLENRIIESPFWKDPRLETGMVVVGRTDERPYPGIFISDNVNTRIEGVTIHYAEGIGLLAQACENITLEGFKVALRKNSGRLFTTQADATHFSGCWGKIISRNGLYENMMDDAINVHGTYLKITGISKDRKEVSCRYMHYMSWGFDWGQPGDSVRAVNRNTMDILGGFRIESITADNEKKNFTIRLSRPLSEVVEEMGLENVTRNPEVEFSGNTIRNNRARGALFSTPRRVVVENNNFNNVSGSAILLCGDCNGWFESGPCNDVLIKNNRFIDVLTSPFQFCEAIISIYPVIPEIERQKDYFHSGIVIENNYFETFDHPLLFAISVDGLIFRKNLIYGDTRFKPYHSNMLTFNLTRVRNADISSNTYSGYEVTKN